MPTAIDTETQSTLLETVRALPAESQRAVLSYALFLRQQEAQRAEAAEVEWDRRFDDPGKMAKFAQWAQESLAKNPPEPLDYSKL